MAYQVLARKWRPQDFDSVVGQKPVVQALRNALKDERIAQAYLFSGIRGVGKTSVARVLAKALNCQNDSTSDPCNDCATCEAITSGSDLDVLEIDAATYSKVEQVRELTDSLQYGPANNPYKVVIIDEIHRLSRQAFDALLKIVEEPPEHLVFIFATTESEAVPATILSRCQTFQFRRVPHAEMVEHLTRVTEAEGLEASDHAIRLIARASEGSVRDAIALLDQLATYGGGKIADDEVSRIVGGVDLALFQKLLVAIVAGDRDSVSGAVRHVEEQGWDPRNVYGEFLSYCRDALHLAIDPEGAVVELPADEASSLTRDAVEAGYENLLRLLKLLLESEMSVRRSESAGLALEIALLRAAELPKLTSIEELLSGGNPGTAGGNREGGANPGDASSSGVEGRAAGKAVSAAPRSGHEMTESPATGHSSPEPTRSGEFADPPMPELEKPEPRKSELAPPPPAGPAAHESPSPEPAVPEPAVPEPTAPAASAPGPASPEPPMPTAPPFDPPSETADAGSAAAEEETPPAAEPMRPPRIGEGAELVGQLLERISCVKQPLAVHMGGAVELSMVDGVFLIKTAPKDDFLQRTLRRDSNRKILEQTLSEMIGPAATWRIRAATSDESAAADQEALENASKDVADDPTVQTVLEIFGGRIETVEERTEPVEP